ncbi:MAG: aldehyde dehydrogenase [Rhodoferax sp.]|nr:aldehyde dehydrogenase [Rhodoferax sp.]
MSTLSSRENWSRRAALLRPSGDNFIDGRYVAAQAHGRFDSINPSNGQLLAQVARSQESDVDLAVNRSLQAWRDRRWRGLAPRQRMDVLMRWADLVEQNTEELALLETLDMGKPINDVLGIDLPEVTRTLRYFAECIDKMEGSVTSTAPGALHLVLHEPLGVVGAITPWNYPLLMAVWKLAPILAAGNCVVLKPAEQAPLSCTRLAALFMEAGGPAGVFNLVNGLGPEAGRALALHPDVVKLSFTGSTTVGKLLLTYAGQSNMKRVALETGGKSPQVFLPDLYDLDAAVDRAIGGIFDNAGQVCNAGSRLLVHRDIHDAFVARFTSRAPQLYRPGDPLDPATTLGPLVSQAHRLKVQRCIERGIAEGARAVVMGEALSGHLEQGAFLAPTLFVDADNRMSIAQDEIFGPVATVIPFTNDDEAIALANDSIYGLAASVWTRDLNRSHRFVRDLEAGVVWVNCFGDGDMTQPFGGYKQSGNSRDKHMMSLMSYTQTKSAWMATT